MEKNIYDLAIIGGGPAGLTAAIYMGRAKYKTLILEKEKVGGQITITEEVVNYPGVGRDSGAGLVRTMEMQAKAFGADIEIGHVVKMDLSQEIKTLITDDGRKFSALTVLIATGAHPRQIGFRGEREFKGRGVAYCATCDGEFFTDLDIFVVGGGFAAAEEGLFLTRYGKSVTFIIREPDFTCAKSIADEVKSHKDITIHYNTEVEEVGGEDFLTYAVFRNNERKETFRYDAPKGKSFGLFVFAGYVPNTEAFQGLISMDEQGYIITSPEHATNRSGVFAAGDVCIKNLRQVVTAVADGAIAATGAEKEAARLHKELQLPPFAVKMTRIDHGNQKISPSTSSPQEKDAFLPQEMKAQVKTVLEKFTSPVTIKAYVDNSVLGENLRGFAQEMKDIHPNVQVEIQPTSQQAQLRIEKDGKDSGIAFLGVPGGHEFNSFILALYNVAGPGQEISAQQSRRIAALAPHRIQVVVSLSCTMCPELVQATQKIAAHSQHIQAEMLDLQYFPQLKDKYNIMSVPCMIVDEAAVSFGKKNLQQLLDTLEQQ